MNDYLQSTEFKRQSAMATDNIIKFVFRWVGIGIKAIIDFITSMVKMGVGK